MVCYKYINGERYILPDNREAKKQKFNDLIKNEVNMLLGMCCAEERLLQKSNIDDTARKKQVKQIRAFMRKLYKLLTFEI